MKKILLTFILLTAGLYADSFEKFLDNAVKQNFYLKSSALSIDQADEEGKILTRYKNPSLELEVSQFSPDIGSSENGYSASYTQPLRLWGVGDDKKHLADAINSSATTLFTKKKQNLSVISRFYIQSMQNKKCFSPCRMKPKRLQVKYMQSLKQDIIAEPSQEERCSNQK